MKKLLFPAFCLLSIIGYSQDTVLILQKKFKKDMMPEKHYAAFSSIDKNTGDLHLGLIDNSTGEWDIIDSNWKVINKSSSSRGTYDNFSFERFNTMRVINSNGNNLAIYSPSKNLFVINTIDFEKKKEVETARFRVNSKETTISYFTVSNIFFLLTADKKSKKFKLITNSKNGGIAFDTISFELQIDQSDKSAAEFMDGARLIRAYDDNIDKLGAPNKMYYFDSSFYITNDIKDTTYTTQINLSTKNITYKKFAQNVSADRSKKINIAAISSYLYNNTLVTANMYDDTLTISFYDYEDASLIKKYQVAKNNAISFKNGYFLKADGTAILPKEEKSQTNENDTTDLYTTDANISNAFFKKLRTGLAVRLESSGDNELRLILSSYRIEQNFSGGGMYGGVPGANFMTPGGMISTPGTALMFYSGSSDGYTIKKGQYVNCLFDKNNFNHLENITPTESIAELINDALKNNDNDNTKTVFFRNNNLYLGFYDSKKENYIIERIAKDLPR